MKAFLAAGLFMAASLSAQEIQLTQIASLPDSIPTDIQTAADGSGRLFIAQQKGVVRIYRNSALVATPFLDISDRVLAGGERGLLGLAFPPKFANSGRFYVNYTDRNGDTVIAQYRVSPNPDVADASSEIVLLTIPQPFPNHNGGQIRFGSDGYLYVGMGDGGSGGDPLGNAQNLGSLLGKLLRIDVETEPGSVRIPPDNPFIHSPGARPEIWAYGLRNPWRFTFDRANNDLYIADVGQNLFEEVDYQPASSRGGENYGWNIMEGAHCFGQENCAMQGLTLPAVEYGHADGCSVTGGFVYRGNASPGLRGVYVYGDLCSGRIWGLQRQAGSWTNRLLLASGIGITTFGEDEVGEVFLGSTSGGIFRIAGSRAPRIEDSGVVNVLSDSPGLVPGSFATVYAQGVLDNPGAVAAAQIPLSSSLQNVSVTVDGINAPIWAIINSGGREQVNFQAPFGIAGRQSASVVVSRAGNASPAVSVSVLDQQPAVFATEGDQAIVVHNADFTIADAFRPLQADEYAFLYAVGVGRVSNTPPDGAGGPFAPLAVAQAEVRVSLGGVNCEVPFAGFAPGLVGVYQVNFKVPRGLSEGPQQIILSVNSVQAPAVKVNVR